MPTSSLLMPKVTVVDQFSTIIPLNETASRLPPIKSRFFDSSCHDRKDGLRYDRLPSETSKTYEESKSSESRPGSTIHIAPPSSPLSPHLHGSQSCSRKKKLTLTPLIVLVFYNVSGGPFGIEATISAGGNLFAVLGFALFPFIWSLPEALVTAELGSAFPNDSSGGVAWVEEAFGERTGLVSGYLGWISGATDNAIYPTLFLEYLTRVLHVDTTSTGDAGTEPDGGYEGGFARSVDYLRDDARVRFVFVALLSVLLAGFNYTGLEIVGTASLWVCIVSMSPFIIMCIIGVPQIEPNRWLRLPNVDETTSQYDEGNSASGFLSFFVLGGVLWRPYLNNLFWNLNSFDAAASFAGEVDNLKKTYPRGILWGFVMCYVFYLIPLLVATGATASEQEDWVEGHLATVATEIGGSWLGGWTVFAAGLSNLALFEAEMSADSYTIMGMADRGILPRIFQTRSARFGTPTYGILLGLVVVIIMSVADFGQLVEILNFNYAVSLLMEYAAFAKLRYTRSDLPRPFKVPVPDWAAVLLVLPPCIGIIILFAVSSWITNTFVFCIVAMGLVLYKLREIAQERKWCEFNRLEYSTLEVDKDHEII